jgi:fatty-acyl-CoA synthase
MLYKNENILYFPDRRIYLNYKTADEKSLLLSYYLVSLGLKKGDRIGLLLGNTPEYVLLSYAAARLGFVIVPIDIYATEECVSKIISETDIRILFYESIHPKLSCKDFLSGSGHFLELILIDLSEYFHPEEDHFEAERIWNKSYERDIIDTTEIMMSKTSLEDVFCIIYTSGSTGEYKGIMRTLTSFSYMSDKKLSFYKRSYDMTSKLGKLESLNLFPFYHFAGYLTITSFILGINTLRVNVLYYFHTEKAVNLILDKKIRLINGTPSMVSMIFDYMDHSKLLFRKSIGLLVAGAATDYEYVKKIMSHKKVFAMMSSYGSTECGTIASRFVLKDKLGFTLRFLISFFRKLGYINELFKEEDFLKERGNLLGRVAKGVEVRIWDEDTGQYLTDGNPGEICTRTIGIEQGHYMNAHSDQMLYTEDGFMKTGDIGTLRDGVLYMIGRKKHIIIRGGENISCLELESTILKCPVVKEAAVCAVPDKIYGEEVYACITTLHNEENDILMLHHFLEERLSKIRLPKYYSIYQNLPMTGSGKLDYMFLKNNFQNINNNYLRETNYEIVEV